MTPVLLLGIGVIGGFGAIARFGLDGLVSAATKRAFPLGTFAVNVLGAFLLGVMVGASASADEMRLAGTGALGAFTTFSTWMFESHRLVEDGSARVAAANVVFSLALGLGAVALGRQVGRLL